MKVEKQKRKHLARLAALVRQMRTGMLTTIEVDGSLRSLPLETVELDRDGATWRRCVPCGPPSSGAGSRAAWKTRTSRSSRCASTRPKYWHAPRNENVKIGTLPAHHQG
jgi:hypothetical protein